MIDSSEAIAQGLNSRRGWLLLITAVPSKPDYLRVKLRRRVQRLGAVGLKGAVYALPDNPDAMEGFQWLRREILADGGEATVCVAHLVDGMSDADVIALFNQDRAAEYRDFVAACGELEGRWSAAGAGSDQTAGSSLVAERERLRRRLEEILGRDFFTATEREDAMQAIERVIVLDIAMPKPNAGSGSRDQYRGRVWATRAGVKVDRIASAWLIRREIEENATFVFVGEGKVAPKGSVQFDMFDGEFTHDGERCTFEVLLDHFAISDSALRAIGQMVHDIDLHDDAFGRPETAGLASMIDGVVREVAGDEDRLRDGGRVLDFFAAGVERP
jgi:hypothetical protein